MNMGSSIKVNKSGIIGLLIVAGVIALVYRSTTYNSAEIVTKAIEPPDGELISLKELLSAAIDAARRGGDQVRKIRQAADLNLKSKGETKEGVNDPVTDGDMKSHIEMFYSIRKAFPNLQVISEEHDTSTVDNTAIAPANIRDREIESQVISDSVIFMKDVQVWIDPLDATKEYTENLVQYVTTMVGVSVKGRPVMGVVHRPFTNKTHWGWVDHGLSPDLAAIKKPIDNLPTSPRIIVSISHQGTVRDVATKAFGEATTIVPAAGSGYKILEVIQHTVDAYVHNTAIKKWDLLAGEAILRAMGGRLTTLDNKDLDYTDPLQFKNEAGLLATMSHHQYYLDKLHELKKP